MKANSPVWASDMPLWTAVLTSVPAASEARVTFTVLPTRITAETKRIAGACDQSADGSTISPMETKNTAANIDLSGSTSRASLARTSLAEPTSPTRNAPSAREKSNE